MEICNKVCSRNKEELKRMEDSIFAKRRYKNKLANQNNVYTKQGGIKDTKIIQAKGKNTSKSYQTNQTVRQGHYNSVHCSHYSSIEVDTTNEMSK
jgi:acyl-CoA reductase-like NAD-dependent aldehyde dehydrogenase